VYKFLIGCLCFVVAQNTLFASLIHAHYDRPVLLLHGIIQDSKSLRKMEQYLKDEGFQTVIRVDIGSLAAEDSIPTVAKRIGAAVEGASKKHGSRKIDLVAFSMGALAARYYIQLQGGHRYVNRFVSISGPLQGTYVSVVALGLKGMRDMMPASPVFVALKSSKASWGDVEVHSLYTPNDVIIVPANSSVIEGAHVKSFPHVTLHHQMVKSKEVLKYLADVLKIKKAAPISDVCKNPSQKGKLLKHCKPQAMPDAL